MKKAIVITGIFLVFSYLGLNGEFLSRVSTCNVCQYGEGTIEAPRWL